MNSISYFFKRSLPHWLESLPIPDSLDDISHLNVYDILLLTSFFFFIGLSIFSTLKLIIPFGRKNSLINKCIQKDNPKVVDLLQVDDIEDEKITYCRCWKSKKFPLCDGSHNKHNEETGDNVGPLVIKKNIPVKK